MVVGFGPFGLGAVAEKAIEDTVEMLGGDAGAGIGNLDHRRGILTPQRDHDLAAVSAEARGVVEKVLEDLADPIGGAADPGALPFHVETEANAAALPKVQALDDLGQ